MLVRRDTTNVCRPAKFWLIAVIWPLIFLISAWISLISPLITSSSSSIASFKSLIAVAFLEIKSSRLPSPPLIFFHKASRSSCAALISSCAALMSSALTSILASNVIFTYSSSSINVVAKSSSADCNASIASWALLIASVFSFTAPFFRLLKPASIPSIRAPSNFDASSNAVTSSFLSMAACIEFLKASTCFVASSIASAFACAAAASAAFAAANAVAASALAWSPAALAASAAVLASAAAVLAASAVAWAASAAAFKVVSWVWRSVIVLPLLSICSCNPLMSSS